MILQTNCALLQRSGLGSSRSSERVYLLFFFYNDCPCPSPFRPLCIVVPPTKSSAKNLVGWAVGRGGDQFDPQGRSWRTPPMTKLGQSSITIVVTVCFKGALPSEEVEAKEVVKRFLFCAIQLLTLKGGQLESDLGVRGNAD
ncbi:hypothetical protein ElyMa_004897900 [Elysia marginata]|uniref:Uncharacterized protein n=1 Tax=Elysia marginata TaxID=1093978 RepID=A0AAV4IWD2_9GAST|nr:hypothetical protein ElyMa_004897900 [Elysia marginata]